MLKRWLSGAVVVSMLFGVPGETWAAPVLRGEKADVIPGDRSGGKGSNPAAAQVKHDFAVEAAKENNPMPQAPASQPAAPQAASIQPPKVAGPATAATAHPGVIPSGTAAAMQPQSASAPAKVGGSNAAPLNQAQNNVSGKISPGAQAIIDWITNTFPGPKIGNKVTAGLQGLINLINALPPGMVTTAPAANGGLTITIGGVITITLAKQGLGVVVTVGVFGLVVLQINGTMFGTTIQVIPGSGITIGIPSNPNKPTTVTIPWPNGPPITFTF